MAVTNEQLVAVLSANVRKFERAMDKAAGKADKSFTKIERRGKQMESRLSKLGKGLDLGRILGPAAAAAAARGFQVFADASTRIENALKVAGLEGENLNKVYDRLAQSAKDNFAPFESLVELYSRASQVQKELGISSEELLNFTDKIAVALRVSGKSAAESKGALLQLSQALGSGVVRAEEFNSILEGALPIAQAAAAGLEEAGGSVSKLRTLVIEGKISSEAFFRAFEAGAETLETKVAGATVTTGQAFEQLKTELIQTAGKMDDALKFTEALSYGLQTLTGVVEGVGDAFERLTGNLGAYQGRSIEYLRSSKSSLEDIIKTTEAAQNGDGLLDKVFQQVGSGTETIRKAKEELAGIDREIKRIVQSSVAGGFVPQDGPKKVSLKDFKVPTKAKKKSTKKAPKSPAEKFGDDISKIKQRTAALQAETQALALLDPLLNDYGFTLAKVRAEQQLLAEAQRAGLEITPQLREQIGQLASGYAQAGVESAKLAEAQGKIVKQSEDMKQFGQDLFSGFLSDLKNGANAADALQNALGRVVDRMIDMAAQQFALSLLGGGGTGGPINLLKRANGGPIKSNRPYMVGERGPEMIIPNQSGVVVPNHKIQSAQTSNNSSVFAPVINAQGADPASLARVEQQLKVMHRDFGAKASAAVDFRKSRGFNI